MDTLFFGIANAFAEVQKNRFMTYGHPKISELDFRHCERTIGQRRKILKQDLDPEDDEKDICRGEREESVLWLNLVLMQEGRRKQTFMYIRDYLIG